MAVRCGWSQHAQVFRFPCAIQITLVELNEPLNPFFQKCEKMHEKEAL
jgi:hypothetical protein